MNFKPIWIFHSYLTTDGKLISLGYEEGNNSTGNVISFVETE